MEMNMAEHHNFQVDQVNSLILAGSKKRYPKKQQNEFYFVIDKMD